MFKNFQIMKLSDFNFYKTSPNSYTNGLFILNLERVFGLGIVSLIPNTFPETSEDLVVFYFKDLNSALYFVSHYSKRHSRAFWLSKHDYIYTYKFWVHFSSSLSAEHISWLNVLNGFDYAR